MIYKMSTDKAQTKKKAFTKKQLLASKKFADCRDLLEAVLDNKGKYTIEQAEVGLDAYRKDKVK